MKTTLFVAGLALATTMACRPGAQDPYTGMGGTGVSSISIPEPSSFGKVGDKDVKDLRIWVAKSSAVLKETFDANKKDDCSRDDKGRILTGAQESCTIRWSSANDKQVQADAKFKSGDTVYFALKLYSDDGASAVVAMSDLTKKDDKAVATDCGYAEEVLADGMKIALPVCASNGTVATGTSSVTSGDGASVSVVPAVVNGGTESGMVVQPPPSTGGVVPPPSTGGSTVAGNTAKVCTGKDATKPAYLKLALMDPIGENDKHCLFKGTEVKVNASAVTDTSDPNSKTIHIVSIEGAPTCKGGLTADSLRDKDIVITGTFECK